MIAKVALTLLLAQYVRSRVDDSDPTSQCLWWHEDTEIVMRQNAAGNPNTGGTEFGAFSAALAAWQQKLTACASVTLAEGDRTSTRKVGYFDKITNENITVYRLQKCAGVVPTGDACTTSDDCGNAYDCWQHQDGALAITTTSYNPDTGKVLDSDIEFNSPSFVFTTVDAPVCTISTNTSCVSSDVQNTATHELGHVLGLAHIGVATSLMYPRASPGELSKRVIDPGSAQFVCDVYPRGRPTRTCVIKPVSSTLGAVARGCSAAPLELLPALSLLALARRRRR